MMLRYWSVVTLDKSVFVVFDLDDTLYKEDDFHESGLNAVSRLVLRNYQIDINSFTLQCKSDGVKDIFASVCEKLKLPLETKESLLWAYRLHIPNISLDSSVDALLKELQRRVQGIAILTDGRSITQRNKLESLGLRHIPIYISEEWSSLKPSPLRFKLIMENFPATKYIYVGDNPKKDFKAPNDLGWSTIGLKDNGRNIHSQCLDGFTSDYLPDVWIDELEEIVNHIC